MKLQVLHFVLLASLALGFLNSSVVAQKSKGKNTPVETTPAFEVAKSGTDAGSFKIYHQIYESAILYNDFAVATDAMYHMIALEPNNAALKDTLAALYFQRGAWPQVVLVTSEVLAVNAENQGALELRAVANQSIGRAKESLEDYEGLYKRTKSPYHLYEIAALQFSMKRFGECELSIRQLLASEEIKDKTIVISVQDGRSQDVPLPAAVMNLNGVLDLEQGKKATAKAFFENAIKIYPEFILAKNNLDAVDAMK